MIRLKKYKLILIFIISIAIKPSSIIIAQEPIISDTSILNYSYETLDSLMKFYNNVIFHLHHMNIL